MLPLKDETAFRKKVLAFLKMYPEILIIPVQQVAIRGIPDLVLCIGGLFGFLELKADQGSKVSKLQLFYLETCAKLGGYSRIVYPQNFEEIKDEILNFVKLLRIKQGRWKEDEGTSERH